MRSTNNFPHILRMLIEKEGRLAFNLEKMIAHEEIWN